MLQLIDTLYAHLLTWLLITIATSWLIFIIWRHLQQKNQNPLVELVNSILPQTQCEKCGYSGCLPYAYAITQGEEINKCPPGGDATISWLAELLNQPAVPLNLKHGNIKPREVATIREAECIGCTKCIDACPVDAIIGGPKLMHTVIQSECSGCELCINPCPVDCIDMMPLFTYYPVGRQSATDLLKQQHRGEHWLQRYKYRINRLEKDRAKPLSLRRDKNALKEEDNGLKPFSRIKARKEIAAAVARVEARRHQTSQNTKQSTENE